MAVTLEGNSNVIWSRGNRGRHFSASQRPFEKSGQRVKHGSDGYFI